MGKSFPKFQVPAGVTLSAEDLELVEQINYSEGMDAAGVYTGMFVHRFRNAAKRLLAAKYPGLYDAPAEQPTTPAAPSVVVGQAPSATAGCWYRYAEEPVGPKGCVCDNRPYQPQRDCVIAGQARGGIQTRTDCDWFGSRKQVTGEIKADPRTRSDIRTYVSKD